MTFWKTPFKFLFSFIWKESLENWENPPKSGSPDDEQTYSRNPLWKAEVEVFVLNLWEKLLICEGIGDPDDLAHLFRPQNCIAEEDMNAVKVAQEVLKQKGTAAIQKIRDFRKARDRDVQNLIGEQKKTIDSLTKQLRVLSRKVGDAEEAVDLIMTEKQDLKYTYGMYAKQNGMLKNLLGEKRVENETLELKFTALTKLSERWELRAGKMQEAKTMAQVRALRAERKAELAEVRAKHASSEKKMMDMRLKEAESSSKTISQHVEDLRQKQAEFFRTLAHNSGALGVRFGGNKINNFMRKSSKVLCRLWTFLGRGNHDDIPAEHEQAEEYGGADAMDTVTQGPCTSAIGDRFKKVRGSLEVNGSRDVLVEDEAKAVAQRWTSSKAWKLQDLDENPGHQAIGASGGQQTVNPDSKKGERVRETGDGESCSSGDSGDRIAQTVRTTGFIRILSMSSFSGQSNNPSSELVRTQELVSKTLEALKQNFEALREIIEVKQSEIERLQGELYVASNQSNAFERCLSKERHKLRELKFNRPSQQADDTPVRETSAFWSDRPR